jgi:hypothetical protein
VLIRLLLIVLVVGAVGVFTGTIKPQEIIDRPKEVIERVTPPTGAERVYLRMVDGNFERLDAVGNIVFSCDPNTNPGACRASLAQLIRQMRVFQGELRRADVPASLRAAHRLLTRAIDRGIAGLRLAQRGLASHRRRDFMRALAMLQGAARLLDRAEGELDRQR